MLYSRLLARSSPADAPFMRQVQADLAAHLLIGLRLRAAGHVLVALVIVLLLRGTHSALALLGWLGVMVLVVGGTAAWLRSAHREHATPAAAASRLQAFVWVEGAIGLTWMLGYVTLVMGSDTWHRSAVFAFGNLWFAAMMQSLSAHPPALYAAFVPVAAGALTVMLVRPGPFAVPGALVVALWFVIILNFTRQLHLRLVASLQLRHEADALAAALQVEKDRALALSQARSRFLAAASHDLRQPVHALLMFVAALRHEPPANESRQLLGHVNNTVLSMERMFNGLLDMSRLDAGMLRPAPRAVDLPALLAPAVAEEAAVAAARGLTLRFMPGTGPLPPVASDPLMLERIVRNLLSNAVRYTQQGGVRLQIRRRPAGVDIRVADSGIGIAREHQQAVYQEFFQLQAGAAGRTEGLGLGLAIAKRLCDLLGHRLSLRSRVGRGSIFTLRLAWAQGLPAVAGPALKAAPRAEAGPGSAGVVVIVDELDVTRLALRSLITGWGHRVLAVRDVTELQDPGHALDAAPCAIVCDSGPASSAHGVATIERLRMEFNDDIPAVLLFDPAHDGPQTAQPMPGLAVIAKPVNEQTLRDALAAALGVGLGAGSGVALVSQA
jgi:two-component system, sensor histidine kinase